MFVFVKDKKTNSLATECGKYWQFEVLNELKDLSNRRSENLLHRTRYLFEDDNSSLDEQYENAKKYKDIICRVVYSGKKSLHCIIELDYDAANDEEYKWLWHYLNKKYFNDKCDTACSNANRLTRRPNGIRSDYNCHQVLQQLIHESAVCLHIDNEIIEKMHTELANKPHFELKNSKIDAILNKNRCSEFECVRTYLDTPYPKMTGNGGASSKGLFASVCACLKYNDTATLEKILTKARRERWSDIELNRVVANAKKAVTR